ncbi:MAG: hypothetical protein WDA74_10475 [Spirochaetota bacterium]
MIKFIKLLAMLLTFLVSSQLYSAELASSLRIGYSPEVGGSMHSGWQLENLGVEDGIYDINRSAPGFELSTVESPVGLNVAFDFKVIMDKIYLKAGAGYNRTIARGKGTTLDFSVSEEVNVEYKQWSFHFPLTFGATLLFWNEARISLGCGIAFAYGNYSNSFKSDTLDHSGSFSSYAFPLVAELSGEAFISSNTSIICSFDYFYGKSKVVKDKSDYGRVDFSGMTFSIGFVRYFNR